MPPIVTEDNNPMPMDSRRQELIQEKGKIGCLSSTMTRTQREILGHLWATLMAREWNQLETPILTCLPPCLGCLKSCDWTTYPQPLHMSKTSHSAMASF